MTNDDFSTRLAPIAHLFLLRRATKRSDGMAHIVSVCGRSTKAVMTLAASREATSIMRDALAPIGTRKCDACQNAMWH